MESTTLPPHKYQELEGWGSFRLLNLHPAENSAAELRCDLIDSTLKEAPKYEAVSYTWDDAVFPITLRTEHGFLKITENLASALRRFRYGTRMRTLWVDAVCINQASIPERNHQVSIMSEIYRGAAQVLCWIGESNEWTEMALAHLTHLAASVRQYGLADVDAQMWFKIPVLDAPEDEARRIIAGAREHHLSSIYGRRWFSRLWVVQEVTLAQRAIMCCGNNEMDWKVFASSILVLVAAMERTHMFVEDGKTFLFAWTIVRNRAKYRLLSSDGIILRSSHTGFAMLVSAFRAHGCSVDHDRIYALLGLRSSDYVVDVKPDYSQSVTKLYTDFAILHLRKGEIEILYDAGLVFRSQSSSESNIAESSEPERLPSWAPEYRLSRGSEWLVPYPWDENEFQTAIDVPPLVEVEENHEVILVSGMLLDYVKFAFNIPTTSHEPLLNFASIRELVSICKREYYNINPQSYPTLEDSQMVLARLLLVDGSCSPTHRYLRDQTEESLLEHWIAFEEHCLKDNGEVYLRYRELDTNPSSEDEVYSSLSVDAKKGWIYFKCLQMVLGKFPIASMVGGVFGFVPPGIRAGDAVAVIDGARIPYILRPVGDTSYQLLGACYVHGIMQGGITQQEWYKADRCKIRLV